MSPEEEADLRIGEIRKAITEALYAIDRALGTRDKLDKRRFMLHVGTELHGAVQAVEQLLKVEPPR